MFDKTTLWTSAAGPGTGSTCLSLSVSLCLSLSLITEYQGTRHWVPGYQGTPTRVGIPTSAGGYPIVVRTRYRYQAPGTRVLGPPGQGTQPILNGHRRIFLSTNK
eukprot:961461-Rhodomonas_salina.1